MFKLRQIEERETRVLLQRIFNPAVALPALAFAALSTGALAADLPSRRAPPVYVPPVAAPPVFTWTGLYVGGQVGYGFGTSHSYAFAPGLGGLAAASANTNGVIGGAHIGYNYAVPSVPFFGGVGGAQLVVGVEGDVDGSSAKPTYALGGINVTTSDTIQGSVRGRVGIAVDRALFYATGGAAFGGLTNTYVNSFNGLTDQLNHTRVGYTVGGGVEYALTNNWSIRAEYRRTDFGHVTDTLSNATGGGVSVRNHEVDNRVQAGFSYKFDMFSPVAAPVVARY
jgi:outer membrane immunogenic protein